MSIKLKAALAATPLALAFLLGTGAARADVDLDRYKGRERDAIEMCRDHAEEVLRDRGKRKDIELDEIVRADEDHDRVKVQGYLNVEDRRRRGWLDCDVNFEGDNKISYFDDDGLLKSVERDRGRDRDRKERRGDLRENATDACREMVKDQGFDVTDMGKGDRSDSGMRLDMRLRRTSDRFRAVCVYDAKHDDARFARLDRD